MNKAINIYNKIRELFEEYFFPTAMKLRPMSPSEAQLYNSTYFPDSSPPCIGSFLNVTWIAILDYNGLTLRPIDDANHSFINSFRAKSPEELATVFKEILDTLVIMSTEDQLYDNDYLGRHNFVPVNSTTTIGEK